MSSAAAATQPPRPPRIHQDEFTRALKWSLIAHGAMLFVIVVKGLVFPSKAISYIPSLRVDVVDLPDVLKKDKSKLMKIPDLADLSKDLKEAESQAKDIQPKKAPKVDAEMADPDEMVLNPKAKGTDRKKKMKSALDRIKSLSKISDDPQEAKAITIKGNKLSKGTALGEGKESDDVNYYDVLRERLQENWALPVWLARQNLAAQVQVFIDEKGKLRGFKFVKASGNEQFDEAIKRTLQDSQPFPLPPEAIRGSLATSGITVGFPL